MIEVTALLEVLARPRHLNLEVNDLKILGVPCFYAFPKNRNTSCYDPIDFRVVQTLSVESLMLPRFSLVAWVSVTATVPYTLTGKVMPVV